MRLLNQKLYRYSKLTNFYRKFVNDVKLYSSKAITLQVVGCGSPGESPSICLSTNNEKYLFNCGEDSNRLLIDQNIKISQITHIFLTQNKWNCIGGISGLSKEINTTQGWLPMFHGPHRLYKSIKRMLCLSILKELDFQPIDCNRKKFYENDILRIDFISTKNPKTTEDVFAYVGHIKSQLIDGSQTVSDLNPPIHFIGNIVTSNIAGKTNFLRVCDFFYSS